jgi:EAL and modified HD-GYP domain-containing signal transduction protein
MGLERIRAWASLFAMAGLGSRPIEILNLGLLRANLCERLSRLCGKGLPEAAYTVGLLSVLDAMLSRPITELTAQLPLPEDIKRGLTHHEGSYGELLDGVMRLERNQWPSTLCAAVSPADLSEAFAASSATAFDIMAMLADD